MAAKGDKPSVEEPNFNTDYEPFKQRNVAKPTNDIESMANITKGIWGTGILSLPNAFKCAGLVMGIICITFNGILATVGLHILVSKRKVCDLHLACKGWQVPVMTYTNAMRYGVKMGPPKFRKFSEILAKLTDTFIITYQVGIICVHVLFVAVTMKYVIDSLTEKDVVVEMSFLIMVVPAMAVNSLKNLKMLVPLSYVSLLMTIVVVIIIFYYIFREPLVPINERKMVNDITLLPQVIGTTLFAFSSVPISVSTENSMKNPSHFHYVYDVGVVLLGILYLSIGLFGYWKWGDDVADAVNLNLPATEILAVTSNICYATAVFIAFGLNGIVPVRLLFDTYMVKHLEDSQCKLLWEYVLRIGMIAFAFFMAASVPFLGELISLLATITVSHLTLMFPCILDICVRYEIGYGRLKWRIIIDVILIIYGFIVLVLGIYVNLSEIAYKMATAPNIWTQ